MLPRYIHFLNFSLIALVVFGIASTHAETISKSSYESIFTPQGRKAAGRSGPYLKDVNIWVYTSAFATRFGMPEEWIDDSLKGAQALAYRVDTGVVDAVCEDGKEQCERIALCMLDVFLPETANLDWINNIQFDMYYGRRSLPYLTPQTDDVLGNTYRRSQGNDIGISSAQLIDSAGKTSDYVIAEYDREINRGLDYLVGAVGCGFESQQDMAIELAQKQDGRSRSVPSPHKVSIPNSFMEKVAAYNNPIQIPSRKLYDGLEDYLLLSATDIDAGDTYATRFTAEGRQEAGKENGIYPRDQQVWVYTSDFATRFGMPEEWIDDSLTGAEAVAYRVEIAGGLREGLCGYFGEGENCSPSSACMLDMYIAEEANLPWNTKTKFDNRYGRKSLDFLFFQDPKDTREYLHRRAKRGTGAWPTTYPLGLDAVAVRDDNGSYGNYSIAEYDREIYNGLDYIAGTVSCGFVDGHDAYLAIAVPVFREDGSVNFNKAGRKGYIAHQVDIPNSFMARVSAYSAKEHDPISLVTKVKQRFQQNSKTKEKE